jgi:hypothetical protein
MPLFDTAKAVTREPHPLAGHMLRLHTKSDGSPGDLFFPEGWFDEIVGKPWGQSPEMPCCQDYAFRAAYKKLPIDDDVLLGYLFKDCPRGEPHLRHASEIENLEVIDGCYIEPNTPTQNRLSTRNILIN